MTMIQSHLNKFKAKHLRDLSQTHVRHEKCLRIYAVEVLEGFVVLIINKTV